MVVVKDGQAKILPLAQAKSFNVYTQEELSVAVGDTLRITKNFRVGTSRFRNNEPCTVTAIDRESIIVGDSCFTTSPELSIAPKTNACSSIGR